MDNATITESEYMKAAEDVEKLDRDRALQNLQRELLADSSNSSSSSSSVLENSFLAMLQRELLTDSSSTSRCNCSSNCVCSSISLSSGISSSSSSNSSPLQEVDFNSITAWLDGLAATPAMFTNLLDKPLLLDESTMTGEAFRAALQPPPTTTATPISISSTSSSPVKSQPSPPLPTTFYQTPERKPPAHSTCAPKRAKLSRHYSRWSMDRLQNEFVSRFQPASQKRLLDRQFMIDALAYNDSQVAKTQQ
jgi:hypothetical protein